jgi:acetyl esterase/lipase
LDSAPYGRAGALLQVAAVGPSETSGRHIAYLRAMTPLGLLNAIVPKDRSSHRVASNVAYGPHHRHRLDVYAPRHIDRPLPVMVFILGGGWSSGDRREYSFAGRALASLGFVTVVPDFRVVPEVRYPTFIEDCGVAAKWAIAHARDHGGDSSRFVFSGHSAGAYNASMLALAPERFGVPEFRGKVIGFAGLSGPYDFYPFDVKESMDAFAGADDPRRRSL